LFAIVLIHPQIPPNTGNVIRLAANTGCALHLVEPLGFALEDRALRRAGLDYHEYARVAVHPDWAACQRALEVDSGAGAPHRYFAFSTKASRPLFNATFRSGDVLVFGCETAGLSETILASFAPDTRLRIPMREGMRSLNLSNAVAIAVYEAWRQQGFAGACET
jgi:tRNA (cytidine/uridine-2'-O-)-methyltransferase